MTRNNRTRRHAKQWETADDILARWATRLTIDAWVAISRVLTAVFIVLVTFVVVVGGLWLIYTYLPAHVSYIVLAVLVVDLLLGIALRAVLTRR
jgi:hypothetical protein